jgi:hypothetical protein
VTDTATIGYVLVTGHAPVFVKKKRSQIVIDQLSDEAAADEAYIRAVNCVRELNINKRIVK